MVVLTIAGATGCLDWNHFRDASVIDAPTDSPCVAPSATDYCASVPALTATPLIDGVLECGLRLQSFSVDNYRATTGPLPAGVMASFAVAWRPDGLYVFAQLQGSNDDPPMSTESPWCGDDLEIFVDHDGIYASAPNYDPDTSQFIIAAPALDATLGTRAGVYSQRGFVGPWPASQWVSKRVGGTVSFEAFVSGQDLNLTAPWNAMAAQHVGFDLAMTLGTGQPSDAGSCHHTLGQFVLRRLPGDAGCTHPSCSVAAFCGPVLAP